jgi:hypothetical protein
MKSHRACASGDVRSDPATCLRDEHSARCRRAPVRAATGSARVQRAFLAAGLQFLALTLAYLLPGPQPALAQSTAQLTDWALICPQGSAGEPYFHDPRGFTIPILDLGVRAIASSLCKLTTPAATTNYPVTVTNHGASTIYVAFTNYSTQQPATITWTNCTVANNQATIPTGMTCYAQVPTTAGMTRFCAFTTLVPTGRTPNCNLAQANNQTMIETNFGTGANGVCFPTSLASCVWYDISVIPQNCTPSAWSLNYCQNTGGASYNLPVSLASSGQVTFTCKGPPSSTPYGNANYPSMCGVSTMSPPGCVGNTPTCVNAFFFPTPTPQPNVEAQGSALVIMFLSGP